MKRFLTHGRFTLSDLSCSSQCFPNMYSLCTFPEGSPKKRGTKQHILPPILGSSLSLGLRTRRSSTSSNKMIGAVHVFRMLQFGVRAPYTPAISIHLSHLLYTSDPSCKLLGFTPLFAFNIPETRSKRLDDYNPILTPTISWFCSNWTIFDMHHESHDHPADPAAIGFLFSLRASQVPRRRSPGTSGPSLRSLSPPRRQRSREFEKKNMGKHLQILMATRKMYHMYIHFFIMITILIIIVIIINYYY